MFTAVLLHVHLKMMRSVMPSAEKVYMLSLSELAVFLKLSTSLMTSTFSTNLLNFSSDC